MAQLPAICDRCGTAFNSGIAANNVRGLTIENCGAGPCPACGGIGHIPDGLYNIVGNVVTVLQAPERTVAELRRLKEILEDARRRCENPQATAERVERELPALSAVAQEFRRTPVGTSAALGMLLLTAILAVQAARDSAPQDRTIVVEQTINNYVTTLPNAQRSRNPKAAPLPAAGSVAGPKSAPVRVAPRPGRNEPCPCGSGKKYKKCCDGPTPAR